MTEANDSQRELIAFRIGRQEFCVDIMSVREIRGWTPATPLPRSPGYMKGVINLRGTVLPIIDLGARFGLETSEPTARHVIMVAHIGGRMVGLLVDAVSDILEMNEASVQPTPDVASDQVKTLGLTWSGMKAEVSERASAGVRPGVRKMAGRPPPTMKPVPVPHQAGGAGKVGAQTLVALNSVASCGGSEMEVKFWKRMS